MESRTTSDRRELQGSRETSHVDVSTRRPKQLTHDQVYGAEVEDNFRAAGWEGPPTTIGPALARKT